MTFFFKPIHSLRLLGHLPRLSKSLAFVNSATHSKLHLLPLLVFLMFSSSDPCLSLGGQTPSSASDILFVTEPAPSACQLLTSTLAGWRLSSPTSFASISQLLGLPILGEKHTFLSELPPDSGRLPTTRERATVWAAERTFPRSDPTIQELLKPLTAVGPKRTMPMPKTNTLEQIY